MITAIVAMLGGWRAAAFAALAVVLLGWAGAGHLRANHANTLMAAAKADKAALEAAIAMAAQAAEAKARATEQNQARAFAEAETKHAEEMTRANDTATRVAADLRTGTVSLRRELTACRARPVPGSPTPSDDAGPELRDAVARTVAIGARCDADIRSLQAKLVAERMP